MLSGHLRNLGDACKPGRWRSRPLQDSSWRAFSVSAWTCPVNPGPGCRMRSSIGSAWGPAPQGPWSEQLRMDVLLDGMRRGHPVPGWAGHRACGPDLVSMWKGSHINTHDLCPGLSGWSGLAWAPSVRPPRRYSGFSPCLGSVGGPEALLLHWPPPTGGEGTSPCPCQLGTGQSKLRGVGTRVWSSLHESYRVWQGASAHVGQAGCVWFFPPFSWEVRTCAAQPVMFIFQDGDTLSSPTPHTMSGWA